jgi:hypothetical protein
VACGTRLALLGAAVEGGEGFFVCRAAAGGAGGGGGGGGGEEAAAGYAKVKNLRLAPTRVYQAGSKPSVSRA